MAYQVRYEPAESSIDLFGGNSYWRGPVWFPVNYLIIEAAQKFHSFAESLSQKAYARVVGMGVEIRTNALVERVDAVRSGRGRAHCQPYGALDGGSDAVARWPVAVARVVCTPGERPGPRAARVKSTCRQLSIIRHAQSLDRNRDQDRHVDMLTPVDNSSRDRRPTASEPTRPAPRLACCSQVETVGTVSGSGTGVAMVRSCHARRGTHPFGGRRPRHPAHPLHARPAGAMVRDQRRAPRRGMLGHRGRRRYRPATGGDPPGDRRDRLHERLPPHQRHRDRLARGRINGNQLLGPVRKGRQP
jgi:Glycosyl hydrolase family 63 C-terminal domain